MKKKLVLKQETRVAIVTLPKDWGMVNGDDF